MRFHVPRDSSAGLVVKLGAIADYWRDLRDTVHPEDRAVLDAATGHGFDLHYPPPAYIGDILNAPVIILQNNGGFGPGTAAEFSHPGAAQEYRDRLAAPSRFDPQEPSASPYYAGANFAPWLESGAAALVNAVAYRSPDGKAPRVAELAKTLPSARFHRRWLREALFPLVDRGQRFVVVHRWTRWCGAADIFRGHPGAIFSTAPVSVNLTAAETAAAEAFLTRPSRP